MEVVYVHVIPLSVIFKRIKFVLDLLFILQCLLKFDFKGLQVHLFNLESHSISMSDVVKNLNVFVSNKVVLILTSIYVIYI